MKIENNNTMQPLLIIGKTGTLGNAFARICEARNIAYKLLSRNDVDICRTEEIKQTIIKFNPWAIINTAGYVRVDDAEKDCDTCFACNINGALNLAQYCSMYSIKLLTFSSDLVFDGNKNKPYTESDKAKPLNMYGIVSLLQNKMY